MYSVLLWVALIRKKYISQRTCADFIVSSTDYFRYNDADEYISEETIAEIQENTSETVSGRAI